MRPTTEHSITALFTYLPGSLVLGLISSLFYQTTTFSQESLFAYVARVDSLGDHEWSEETLYSIEMLRLERWLREHSQNDSDQLVLNEVARLKKEAEEFAATGDFVMAEIWLETIWGLLLPTQSDDLSSPESDLLSNLAHEPDRAASANFSLSKELLTGVDLWRQQFQFAFSAEDSTFIESSGNPFTGIRLNINYQAPSRRSLQGYTALKYSRDYLTGEADLRFTNPIGPSSLWSIDNRFEINSFYGDYDLKYLQNVSEMGLTFSALGPFSLDLEEEFWLRMYDNQSPSSPSYLNNALRGRVRFNRGIGAYVGAEYTNISRSHTLYKEYDYREHRLDVTWYQSLGESITFSLEDELRWRDYTSTALNDIFQDHKENYLRADLRLPFTAVVGTELEGSVTYRDYNYMNVNSLPDYVVWEVEPELYFAIGSNWRINFGFYVSEQTYDDLSLRAARNAVDVDTSIPFDNNATFGPTFSIEFFQLNGLMFSVRESYQLQRYPDAQTDNLLGSNLYSDRNRNSILVYFTWYVNDTWRLNGLANIDHDHSRRSDSGDFQNTIVGLEVNYSF